MKHKYTVTSEKLTKKILPRRRNFRKFSMQFTPSFVSHFVMFLYKYFYISITVFKISKKYFKKNSSISIKIIKLKEIACAKISAPKSRFLKKITVGMKQGVVCRFPLFTPQRPSCMPS